MASRRQKKSLEPMSAKLRDRLGLEEYAEVAAEEPPTEDTEPKESMGFFEALSKATEPTQTPERQEAQRLADKFKALPSDSPEREKAQAEYMTAKLRSDMPAWTKSFSPKTEASSQAAVPPRPPVGKRQGGRLVAPSPAAQTPVEIEPDKENDKQDTIGYAPSVAREFKPLYKGLSDEQKDEFNSALAQIRREYDDQKETLGRQELAERLGAALTQLGAGLYGINTGEDMSGLKFQQTDWEKRLDRALGEFRAKRAGLETDRAAALSDVAQRTRSEEVAQSANLQSQQIAETANLAKQRMANQEAELKARQEQATSAKELADITKEMNLRDKLKFDLRTVLTKGAADEETANKIKNDFQLDAPVEAIQAELDKAQDSWVPMFSDSIDPDAAVEQVLPMVYNKIASMRPAARPQQSASYTGYIITDSSGATQRVNGQLTAEQIASIQRAGGRVTKVGN